MHSFVFRLTADSSNRTYDSHNHSHSTLQISESNTIYLSQYVSIACRDKDDYAKDLAIKIPIELSQQQYDFFKIINELSTRDRQLNCYNSKEKKNYVLNIQIL